MILLITISLLAAARDICFDHLIIDYIGRYCSNHEDQEGYEARYADGRGYNAAPIEIQAAYTRHQKMHRYLIGELIFHIYFKEE
jgi:hypothetical protein